MTDEIYLKAMLLGDSAVGKTCLMSTFIDGSFLGDPYFSTVGLDFKFRDLIVDNKTVKLQVWDTAGQERFHSVTRAYYRDADALVIVFDICNEQSFTNINKWISDIKENSKSDVICILVGNKCDLGSQRVVSKREADTLADLNKLNYIECSAKTNTNVNLIFETLSRNILSRLAINDSNKKSEQKVDLANNNKKNFCNC